MAPSEPADRPALPDLVFIGLLPPPIDGQRAATASMRTLLDGHFRLQLFDIGPRDPRRLNARLGLALKAIAGLIAARCRGCRRLYLAPYTGRGLWLAALIQGAARILGFASTVHLHSYLPLAGKRLAMAVFVRIGGPNVLYLCLGEEMACRLGRLYGVARTFSLSNAILVPPPTGRRPRPTNPNGRLRLGHLGNLSFEKGLDKVLATATVLRALEIPFLLEFAGPVSGDEKRALDAALAAEPTSIRYRGPLYGRSKEDWYTSLDVFLFPTRYRHEASPLVLFEAMRGGAVPIANAAGCIADDLGDAGFVVPGRGADSFITAAVDRIRSFLARPEELERLSARAASRFAHLREKAAADLGTLVRLMRG